MRKIAYARMRASGRTVTDSINLTLFLGEIMKNTIFYGQWKQYPAQLDKTMTRERAAKLLRAWRNNSRKNTNCAKWLFKRTAPHTYFVKINDFDVESHTLFVGVKP